MKEKFNALMSRKKMKVGMVAACAALVLSIGSSMAFAANAPTEKSKMLIKGENGKTSYSTDDGATWNDGLPEGAKQITNADGSVNIMMGTPPEDGKGIMVRQMNGGDKEYSTDGGKTWSKTAPEGYTEPAGGLPALSDLPPLGEGGGVMVKSENGVTKHSTDGGKTWVDGLPEGAKQIINDDGTMNIMMGTPPADGKGIMVRQMNGGDKEYSTDGGKTWSKTAPEGFTEPKDGIINKGV
jgi:Neuraminidase (sialidase)